MARGFSIAQLCQFDEKVLFAICETTQLLTLLEFEGDKRELRTQVFVSEEKTRVAAFISGSQALRLSSKSDTLLANLRISLTVFRCRLNILGTLIDSMKLGAVVAVLLLSTHVSNAQSNDQTLPTAVLTNEIDGTIRALDVGDSRLTRHYYAFEATPGDLAITVNSRNLNGDVDVFTAVTFRPLLKISIYANTIPPEVTKGIYFRTRQILILRVEARSPDDDPGSYRITFGGTFQPFSGGIAVAENTESTSESTTSGNGRRLSSVGATIPRPPEPKVEEAKTEEKPPDTEPPKETETKPEPKPKPTRTTTRGSARTRAPRTTRTKPPETKPASESAKTETPESGTPGTEKPKAGNPRTAKSRTTKPKVEPKPTEGEEKSAETSATTQPQEQPGPHLIIEQTDGTRIDRPMSTVRRVIVEGGMIVVVLKTGKIERVPMSAVTRMSIEPQP